MHRSPSLVIAGALVAFHLGAGSPIARSVDQIQSSATRPLPALPPAPAPTPGEVWVPDRYIVGPGGGPALVPGHRERPLADGTLYAPPLVVCGVVTGACAVVPAGPRLPVDQRQGP